MHKDPDCQATEAQPEDEVIQAVMDQLVPELREILRRNRSYEINIIGKPPRQFRIRVTTFIDN